MTKADLDNTVLGLITLLIAAAMFFGSCSTANAQGSTTTGPQGERLTPHLILARLCAHEASLPWGYDSDSDGEIDQWVHQRDHRTPWGDDCWLIHEVLLRGVARLREGGSTLPDDALYVQYAIAYSAGRLLEPREGDTNRWAVYLMPGPTRPQFWGTGRWFVAGWHFVWELTGEIVALSLDELEAAAPFQCDGPVHDWGGRQDGAWSAAHGRVAVHCEGARLANTPYRRPWLH